MINYLFKNIIRQLFLEYVPWTLEMWNEAPDRFKTQEMCNREAEKDPWALRFVLDHFKTQEICDDVVLEDPFALYFVPDWFIAQQQLREWDDYHGIYYNNDKLIR